MTNDKSARVYLCNDRVFETVEDAMIDCAELGILGSDCKDHIEELPFIGRTYQSGLAEGIERGRIEVLKKCNNVVQSHVDTPEDFYVAWENLKAICQPQETEGSYE